MVCRKTQKRKQKKTEGGGDDPLDENMRIIKRTLKEINEENKDIPKEEITKEVESLLEKPTKKLKQMEAEDAQTTILKPNVISKIIKLKKASTEYLKYKKALNAFMPNQLDHAEVYGTQSSRKSRKNKKSRRTYRSSSK